VTLPRRGLHPDWLRRGDRGAAVVDFVLVGALVTLVFVGVLQLAVVLHVRNTLVDCASEGARYGALADRAPADGARRAISLISQDLSPRYAGDVTGAAELVDGLPTVVVRVRAPLPVLGLLGVGRWVTVVGHALREPP
jgi:Flp pilus assembly protein TadG